MKRFLVSTATVAALLVLPMITTGCMTTGKDSRRHEKVAKKKKTRSEYYGLVSSKSKVDRAHLRRGQRAMFSPALDSY